MFVNLKNSSMFAVRYIVEGGQTASNDSGFFISDCQHIGYNTPVLMLNGSTALYECIATGKVIPFFYFSFFNKHFYSIMRYIEDNVLAKNNSIRENTPNGAKTETLQLISELDPYDSCFGVDYENLMLLFNDQMNELSDDLRKGYIHDAQQRLNKMFSLFWVIKDKLPISIFDKVESLNYNVKNILKPIKK